MLPGLLFLIFIVIQFIYRGRREIDAVDWQGEGRCAKCGYDLRGNVSGVCPECGAPVEAGI